jgi:ABC-2 type transport system permease protein
MRMALPVALLGLCVFALLVPVSTVAIAERSIFNVNYTHDQIKFRFFDESLGLAICLAAVVLGVALALVLFAFLRDRRHTASLLSSGILRWRLFAHRWVTGAIAIAVAIAIPFGVSLALNVSALDWHTGELHELLFTASGYCVTALVAFSVAALAATCAGTLFEAVIFSCTILGSVSVVAFGMQSLFEHLLVGNAFGEIAYGMSEPVAPSLLGICEQINPVLFFFSAGVAHQSFTVRFPVTEPIFAPWWSQIIWLVVALVLAIIGAIMLAKRHGEQAQMAGMCAPLSFIAAALAGFGAFAAVFQAVASADRFVALAAGAIAFAAISIWLLRWPLRGRSSRARSLAVLGGELVLLATAVAVVAMGGAGFSTWVPKAAAVAKVELSYIGAPSYLAVPYTGTASNGAYYLHSSYIFEAQNDAVAIDVACDAHKLLIAEADGSLSAIMPDADFASTIIPYDLIMRYTLTDGSEAVRYFDRVSIATLQKLLVLDDSERVRALQSAVITGDATGLNDADVKTLRSSQAALAYQAGSVFLADANYNIILPVSLDANGRQTLLQAIAKDVAAQSLEDRYLQEQQVYGTLLFTNSAATDMTNMGFSFSSAIVPLTPSFQQTRKWLIDAGLLVAKAEDDAIASGLAAGMKDDATEVNMDDTTDGSIDDANAGNKITSGDIANDAGTDDGFANDAGADGGITGNKFTDNGINPALIEEMTFMPDNPYASVVARQGGGIPAPTSRFFIASRSAVPGRFWAVQDFGSLKAISDASKIAQIAPKLRTACFMGGGYFVQAKLRGIEAYVYYYLPESEAPTFVKGGGM